MRDDTCSGWGRKVTLSGLFLPLLPHYHIMLNLARYHVSIAWVDLCLQILYKEGTMKCRSWKHRVPRLELISHWEYTKNKTSLGIEKERKEVVNSTFRDSGTGNTLDSQPIRASFRIWLFFWGIKKKSSSLETNTHPPLPSQLCRLPTSILKLRKDLKESSSEITKERPDPFSSHSL